MATSKYESSFTVSVTGDESGEKWNGVFKVKTRLSHRDALVRDQLLRDFIGKQPGEPSQLARDLATIFSELGARVLDAPSWWTSAGNGLDLEDTNVILEVYSKAIEAEKAAKEELKGKAEESKASLKKSKE